MKRLISFLIILLILPAVNVVAKEYSAENIGIGEILSTASDWKTTDENITVSSESVIYGAKGFAWNEEYKNSNEIIEFNMNTVYDGNWVGVMLRASKPDVYPWIGNPCILFVIKEEQIELQIYADENGGGGYIIQTVENPIKSGVTSKVAVGAIETDNGVQIIFAVDGELIINNVIPDIKNDEGYFTLLNTGTKTNINIPQNDMEYVIPCNISVNGEYAAGNELNIKFDTISTSDNRACEISWYTKAGEIIQEVADGTSYILRNEDLDKYVYAGICETGKEKELYTGEIFFDSAKDYIKKNIVMLKDWFLAYADGKQHQIDSDFSIAPVMIDGKIYVPLRFIAEKMGYDVIWNDKERNVSLKKGTDTITVKSERLKLIKDRSFVDKEAFEKCFEVLLYHDPDTGVIVVDEEKNFDETKENIYKRLYKHLLNGI